MIGAHVYVFFTFFGPNLVEKEEDKKRSIFAHASAILFTVDITHMRRDGRDGRMRKVASCQDFS